VSLLVLLLVSRVQHQWVFLQHSPGRNGLRWGQAITVRRLPVCVEGCRVNARPASRQLAIRAWWGDQEAGLGQPDKIKASAFAGGCSGLVGGLLRK